MEEDDLVVKGRLRFIGLQIDSTHTFLYAFILTLRGIDCSIEKEVRVLSQLTGAKRSTLPETWRWTTPWSCGPVVTFDRRSKHVSWAWSARAPWNLLHYPMESGASKQMTNVNRKSADS